MSTGPSGEHVRDEALVLLREAVDLRRRIHRWPELGLELPRTQQAVLDALACVPVEVVVGKSLSSVVATLEGSVPGPTIVLRADMDALPLHETTGLDFASERPGLMHACGHDAHVAMLVGAARLLATHRAHLAGTVRFVFQPGEEGYHGAEVMLDEGVFDGPPVGAAFAIHSLPTSLSGHVGFLPGPFLASSDSLRITVRGRGGHACAPDQSLDPVPAACEAVLALQSFMARRIDPADPAVLSITRLAAGTGDGVIPDTVTLEGTVRAHSEPARRAVIDGVRRVLDGVTSAHELTAEVVVERGYPPLVNDPAFTRWVVDVARRVVGERFVHVWDRPLMSSDDFACLLARVPGAMVALGSLPPGVDRPAPNHSGSMILDEAAMATGIALHAGVALSYLAGGDGPQPEPVAETVSPVV